MIVAADDGDMYTLLVERVRARAEAVVVSDVRMPRLSGLSALARIRHGSPGVGDAVARR